MWLKLSLFKDQNQQKQCLPFAVYVKRLGIESVSTLGGLTWIADSPCDPCLYSGDVWAFLALIPAILYVACDESLLQNRRLPKFATSLTLKNSAGRVRRICVSRVKSQSRVIGLMIHRWQNEIRARQASPYGCIAGLFTIGP